MKAINGAPQKTLLILGGGIYNVQVIRQVQQIGYRAIVVDRSPNSPGFQEVDAFEVVDIANQEEVLRVARDYHVDGIMPVSEFGVRSYAYATQKLGLTGIDPIDAESALDKGLMRERWKKADSQFLSLGLPQPSRKRSKPQVKYNSHWSSSLPIQAAVGVGFPSS